MIYYLVTSHGDLGTETIIDYQRCERDDVLRSMLSGDYQGRLDKVCCIDQSAGTWTDVSREMAQAAVDCADGPIVGDLLDFCEEHLGCEWMASLAEAS